MGPFPLKRGLISVYTGDGRGKTTAALGLALRVLGWGGRVCVVQFIKGYAEIGEMRFASEHGERFILRQFQTDLAPSIHEEDVLKRRQSAEEALAFAEQAIMSADYDLVILDEINIALHYSLIDMKRVLEIIESKPESVELVLTGRAAPADLIAAADYVTEMKQIRHPFERSIPARRGIDY